MCLLEESWPVGHCGRLRVRALGFCVVVVVFFFFRACVCVCVPWWGRGVSHATPWGRRRIGQTRWKSVCTSRKHWPGDCLWWTRARATQLTTDVSTHMKNNNTKIQLIINLDSNWTSSKILMDQQWCHPMHLLLCQANMVMPPDAWKLLISWSGIRSLWVFSATFHMSADTLEK